MTAHAHGAILRMTALAGLLMVGACSSVGDTVSSFNPFSPKEKILPGERKSVLGSSDPIADAEASGVQRTASIGGAQSLGEWSQPGGGPDHNPGHVALSGSGSWRVKAAESRRKGFRVSASPVVYQGRIYVYDPVGNVSAHSLSGGGRQWRTSLRPEKEKVAPGGGVAAGSGRVFAATGFSQVVSLDASNGAIAWTVDLQSPARSAPTYADGRVFVITAQNTLYALSGEDGTELWTFRGIPESAGVLTAASPAVVGNTVIAAYSSGEIVALEASSGDQKWLDGISRGTRRAAISGLNDVAAHPVASGGTLFATGVGGRTIAVEIKSGRRLWETNIGSLHTPIVSGDALFLSDLDGRLIALARNDGSVLWTTELPKSEKKKKRQVWAGPSLAGGALWLLSNQGNLVTVDPTTGQITNTRKYGSPVYVQPIAVSGKLLVVTGDGTLAAVN